jgi:hypothetical protein
VLGSVQGVLRIRDVGNWLCPKLETRNLKPEPAAVTRPLAEVLGELWEERHRNLCAC